MVGLPDARSGDQRIEDAVEIIKEEIGEQTSPQQMSMSEAMEAYTLLIVDLLQRKLALQLDIQEMDRQDAERSKNAPH